MIESKKITVEKLKKSPAVLLRGKVYSVLNYHAREYSATIASAIGENSAEV